MGSGGSKPKPESKTKKSVSTVANRNHGANSEQNNKANKAESDETRSTSKAQSRDKHERQAEPPDTISKHPDKLDSGTPKDSACSRSLSKHEAQSETLQTETDNNMSELDKHIPEPEYKPVRQNHDKNAEDDGIVKPKRDVKSIGVDVVDAAVFLNVDVDGIEEIHLIDDLLQPPLSVDKATSISGSASSSDPTYDMRHRSRGKAVVINNKYFANIDQRKGTDVDATKLCNRLKNTLGFDVRLANNCTCPQMLEVFAEAAKENYTDADCFVGAILTHGGSDGFIHGTDGEMDQKRIFELFCVENCPSLAGKPKIFFIQACRGKRFDPGVNLKVNQRMPDGIDNHFPSNAVVQGRTLPYLEEELVNDYNVCPEADFLISFSTVAGFFSFRNSLLGSWYIQALIKAIDECGTTHEFLKVLTRVNKIVAYSDRFMSNTGDRVTTGKKQSPSFSSTLTGDLYFRHK